jgi:hypothetical protein
VNVVRFILSINLRQSIEFESKPIVLRAPFAFT